MMKRQTVLPVDTVVRRMAAGPAHSGSPFWRRSIRAPRIDVKKDRPAALHGPECDDCGSRKKLKLMGTDEMGKMYLCQICIETKGTEYSNE